MDKQKQKEFLQKVFNDIGVAFSAGMVYVGIKTGLFEALHGKGPMTLRAISDSTGLQHRYVEEWVKGMASAGYLEYRAQDDTYELPPEHGRYLGTPGNLYYMGGLFKGFPATVGVAPQVADAFRNGGGVHFDQYGDEFYEALDLMNQGVYENLLVPNWIPQIPEIQRALEAGGRALDVGCGRGRVSKSLALGFPNGRFVGVDVHPGSVEAARKFAAQAGVKDRVTYVTGLIDDVPAGDKFDLITFMDVVHDLTQPKETLQKARQRLTPQGTVLVVEPKVSHNMEQNRNPVATMFFGMSLFHCMTQSLARGGPGLGACFGPVNLEALAGQAGFSQFRTVDIPSPTLAFYALRG